MDIGICVAFHINDIDCVVRAELRARLAALADAGLHQVMILPSFDTRHDVLERVGRDLVGQV